MAQLMMNHDIVDNPLLRRHIAEDIDEIETILPDGANLIVHVKRVSRELFAACFRSRLLGREVIVRAYDTDIFQALNRAKKNLMRQVDDVRHAKRDRARLRQAKRRLPVSL